MICNAFGTSGISPATEEIVANIMAKAVRPEMKPACANSDLDDCIPF